KAQSGSEEGDTVSEIKRPLKQRACDEAREGLLIALYLFIVFSLFVIYKWVILAQNHIDFALHGFALFNALSLAKVMLVAQDIPLADRFRDAPLIYPALLKSFVFTIVLACFKITEEGAMGILHGKSFRESAVLVAGASGKEELVLASLFFVMLIPFFAFTELRRVFGADRLMGAFFRSRHLQNVAATGP
ncbi:MAG: hypothetical protein WBR26_04525, partial [Candidatus Acidiferrum sp.]